MFSRQGQQDFPRDWIQDMKGREVDDSKLLFWATESTGLAALFADLLAGSMLAPGCRGQDGMAQALMALGLGQGEWEGSRIRKQVITIQCSRGTKRVSLLCLGGAGRGVLRKPLSW